MSLAERLQNVTPLLPGNKCVTCHWYHNQPQADKDLFDNWVANGWQNKQLLDACRQEGLSVDEQSFSRHVRRCHMKLLAERNGTL